MAGENAFKAMRDAFKTAEGANPDRVHESYYVLGDSLARLRVVGHRLAERMDLPFAHLRTSAAESPTRYLSIELWDQHETGVSCPAHTLVGARAAGHGVETSDDGRFISNTHPASMTCLDRSAERIVGCASDAGRLTLYERGRPLHVPLTVWHNDRDVPVIHAGLVSRGGRGVLLAGPRGMGKSVTSVACLVAGLSYLSDDLVGLRSVGDGSFTGHSIYCSTFLESHDLKRFPSLEPHVVDGHHPGEDKPLVLLAGACPSRLARAATIEAVALVRTEASRHSRIRPASRGEALLAVAPSSLLIGQASSGINGFNKLVRLVDGVPCCWLELGHDLSEVTCRVDELLSHMAP